MFPIMSRLSRFTRCIAVAGDEMILTLLRKVKIVSCRLKRMFIAFGSPGLHDVTRCNDKVMSTKPFDLHATQ